MSPVLDSIVDRVAAISALGADVCRAATDVDVLAIVGPHLYREFDADWVGVGLRSSDGLRCRLVPLTTDGSAVGLGTDLPAEGLALTSAVDGGAVLDEVDLVDSSYRDLAGLGGAGMIRALVVPLRVGDARVGALALARAKAAPFSDDDVLLAQQAAAFVAAAMKNLRSSAEAARAEAARYKAQMILSRRADEIDTLNRMVAELADDEDLRRCLGRLSEHFVTLRGVDVCRIATFDNRRSLQIIASVGEHGARFLDGGPAIRSTAPDAIAVDIGARALWRRPDDDDVAANELLRSLGLTSVAAVPIHCGDEVIGAVTIGSTGGHRLVVDEEIVMAEVVARELGIKAVDLGGSSRFWEAMNRRFLGAASLS